MPKPLLTLVPEFLCFPPPLSRPITNVLALTNTTKTIMAFKVKTTTPKRYCVKPRMGVVHPNNSMEIQITLHPMKEPVEIDVIQDKFLLESVQISPDEFSTIHHQETWWKSLPKQRIIKQKLKCFFEPQVPENIKVVLLNDNSMLIHAQGTTQPNKAPVDGPEGDFDNEEDQEKQASGPLLISTLGSAPTPAPAPAAESEPETQSTPEMDTSSVSPPEPLERFSSVYGSFYPNKQQQEHEIPGQQDLDQSAQANLYPDEAMTHSHPEQQEPEEGEKEEGSNMPPQVGDEIVSLESRPLAESEPAPSMAIEHQNMEEDFNPVEEKYESHPSAMRTDSPPPPPSPPSVPDVLMPSVVFPAPAPTTTSLPPQEPELQRASSLHKNTNLTRSENEFERTVQNTRESLAQRASDSNTMIDVSELRALKLDQTELRAIRAKYTAVCEELTRKRQDLGSREEENVRLRNEISTLKRSLKEAELKSRESLRQRHVQHEETPAPQQSPKTPEPRLDANKYSLITLFIVAIIFFLIGKLL